MFVEEMFGHEKYEIGKQFGTLRCKNRRNVH